MSFHSIHYLNFELQFVIPIYLEECLQTPDTFFEVTVDSKWIRNGIRQLFVLIYFTLAVDSIKLVFALSYPHVAMNQQPQPGQPPTFPFSIPSVAQQNPGLPAPVLGLLDLNRAIQPGQPLDYVHVKHAKASAQALKGIHGEFFFIYV